MEEAKFFFSLFVFSTAKRRAIPSSNAFCFVLSFFLGFSRFLIAVPSATCTALSLARERAETSASATQRASP